MFREAVLSTSLKENSICLWDINSGTNIFEFKENCGIRHGTAVVNVVNRSNDYGFFQQSIYSAQSSKNAIHTWKFGKAPPLFKNATAEKITCLCSSNDGIYLFGGSISGKLLVWCTSNGELINSFDAHYKPITVIRSTPEMGYLITGGEDGFIHQWRYHEIIGGMEDVNASIKPSFTWSQHSLAITDIAVSQNTALFMISSSADKTIRIWNRVSKQLITVISAPCVIHCLCISADEETLYCGGSDGTLYVISLQAHYETSVLMDNLNQNMHAVSVYEEDILSMCLNQDNSKLLTGGKNGKILVWDTTSMQVVKEYKGSNMAVSKESITETAVVFLCVIPYPTLLFENENTLYPIKALKKYRLADPNAFQPILCPESVETPTEQPVFVGVATSSAPASFTVEESRDIEVNKKEEELKVAKANAEKWKEMAEKLYRRLADTQYS